MTKLLCKPCAEARKDAGEALAVLGGRTQKITCDDCGKRRYGLAYVLARKSPREA